MHVDVVIVVVVADVVAVAAIAVVLSRSSSSSFCMQFRSRRCCAAFVAMKPMLCNPQYLRLLSSG
eukprot:3119742-Amphidinium_carterae.1